MDDDLESMAQQLVQEIAFLRNLFRAVVQNGDSQEARDEIAMRILLTSSRLNVLVNTQVATAQPWGPLRTWAPNRVPTA